MLSLRPTLMTALTALALAGCIELPDDLPQARFDAEPEGAGATGGDPGAGGTGGIAPPEQPDAAVDAGRADAAAAPETCNGLDDDLDDSIDEGVRNACGECGEVGEEICDTFDNDCDLVIDEAEQCACEPGLEEVCGRDVGACTAGTRRCSPDGQWGPCSGLGPQGETCNDIDDNCDGDTDEGVQNACGRCGPLPAETCNGVDDDCDGIVDGREVENDVCDCPPGLGEACGSDVGACRPGRRECGFDGWGPCNGGAAPSDEQCDQVDDDCDGTVDEGACECQAGATRPCGSDTGYCQAGIETCNAGRWGACEGERSGRDEICNRMDDDCDGRTDEDACDCTLDDTRPCGSDVGACRSGEQTCYEGGWGPCEGTVGPSAELCNDLDDNCDGRTDEPWPALGQVCSAGVGACRRNGQVVCDGAGTRCSAQATAPGPEICNGLDDDCDGDTDEGVGGGGCNTGEPGVCADGVQRCVGGQLLCEQQQESENERCNGLDDDCDARLDEGTEGGPCDTGDPGRCGPGTLICNGVQVLCEANQGPANETCNGVDDDCDGQVDDPPLLQELQCVVRGFGICTEGTPICVDGETECDTPDPRNEVCNGLDDDCDGSTDEGVAGAECATGQQGVCSAGVTSCRNGAILCERLQDPRGEGEPDSSTCNRLDDDCDGSTDEGHPRLRACELGNANYYCSNGRVSLCEAMPGPEPTPDPEPEQIPR